MEGRPGDVHRSEEQGFDLMADLFGAEFFEEACKEIACVVDQDVQPANFATAASTAACASAGRVTSSLIVE